MTTIGSLCSGYGGLDEGLRSVVGGEVRWHAEIESAPAKILAHHYPGVPNLRDITTVDWTDVEPVEYLTAGYPCQPFSHAGKRKGSDDERHLWPYVADAVRVLRPRVAVFENVAGHVSLGLDRVLADLAALGYVGRWGVLRAADAGAPHNRSRIFIAAADADRFGHERRWATRGRRSRFADLSVATPDSAIRTGGLRDGDYVLPGRRTQRRESAAGRGPITDAERCGWHGWSREPQRATVERTATAGAGEGTCWGAYEPAIRRWERVVGRMAPRPTEPGRSGAERLSPRFVEWMMGLPAGWVTATPGLSRNEQLKALGNGVVPQQAALALRMLGVEKAVAA
jgi:DNA (cytosine-5)-methyltransferase 1